MRSSGFQRGVHLTEILEVALERERKRGADPGEVAREALALSSNVGRGKVHYI